MEAFQRVLLHHGVLRRFICRAKGCLQTFAQSGGSSRHIYATNDEEHNAVDDIPGKGRPRKDEPKSLYLMVRIIFQCCILYKPLTVCRMLAPSQSDNEFMDDWDDVTYTMPFEESGMLTLCELYIVKYTR